MVYNGGIQKEIDLKNMESVFKQRELKAEKRNRIIKRVALFLVFILLLALGRKADQYYSKENNK